MRLNLSTPALFAASSLLTFGSAMPFVPRDAAWLKPLVRKATYSVVPVDGGPSATAGNGSPGITIIQTVTQIPPPTTQTVDITDYIVSTQTIEGPKTTQTLVITITPSASPAQVTTTKYSVIDISAPPVTIIVTAPASTSPVPSTSTVSASTVSTSTISTSIASTSSASTSSVSTSSTSAASSSPSSSSTSETKTSSSTQSLLSATSSTKILSTSSTPLPSTTLTSIASSSTTLVLSPSPSSTSSLATVPTLLSSQSTSVSFTQTTLATITSSATSASTTSTSSKTYDDGMWHTHYPGWNATATVATPVSTPVGVAQKRDTITGLKALLRKNVITQV